MANFKSICSLFSRFPIFVLKKDLARRKRKGVFKFQIFELWAVTGQHHERRCQPNGESLELPGCTGGRSRSAFSGPDSSVVQRARAQLRARVTRR